MATSGSNNFGLNKKNIIYRALQKINIYSLSDTPEAEDYNLASDTLNAMIKSWQNEGFKMWKRKEATLFTAYQTAAYDIGLTGTHCTNSYVSTNLSTSHISGATSLTVDSTTGMLVNDNIGIKLTDSTRFWTTIASINSATTLTLNAGLSAAASNDATVVTYTSKINRPLEIFDKTCRYLVLGDTNEILIDQVRYEDYMSITTKNIDGAPLLFNYEPKLNNGKLRIYLRPNDVDYVLNFCYSESLEDLDDDVNDPDFPQEWVLALIYNLAVLLCPDYGRYQEMQAIEPKAEMLKLACREFDNEQVGITFSAATERENRGN
jgi:hypothetical protein